MVQRGGTAPTYPYHWGLPAGLVDPGETPELAVVREVREGFRLEFKPGPIIYEGRWQGGNELTARRLIYYTGYWSAGPDGVVLQSEEICGYGWFLPEEALRLPLSFNYEDVLKQLLPAW